MCALRYAIALTLLGPMLVPSSSLAHSQDPLSCTNIDGLREFPAVYFVYEGRPAQRFSKETLLANPNSIANWVEVQYSDEGLRLVNRMPGLGLAFNIFNIRMELIDLAGYVVASSQLFASDECSGISLFPGAKTRTIDMPEATAERVARGLRLRVRILASEL